MTDQKHNILEVRDLVVDFPIFGGIMQRRVNSVHAVRKVSFDLIKGETLGIVGESGSGKSTVGNAILNVLRLTAPDVDIDGPININIGSCKSKNCLLYTSPSPRDKRQSRMPSSA